jgi:probable phosphoglycerate mutase
VTTTPERTGGVRAGQRVIVEADGGSRGNPGPAGFGAVVLDADTGRVLAERHGSLGATTNNVAEYTGLVEGLAAAADLGAADVTVRMDSRLVVEQMSGRWRIRHDGLRPLAARAAALLTRFRDVEFEWIPRERNQHADALANQAMDEAAAAEGVPGQASAPRTASASRPPAEGSRRTSWTPRTDAATRLVLVRHGCTAYTAERRYSGRGDVPLSDIGRAEAAAVADRVARLASEHSAAADVSSQPVVAVVSSPLVRCTATAAVIAESLGGVPVQVEPDLIECDFGAWEGLTFADVAERFPAELARWLDSTSVAPPGGESFRTVGARVRRVAAAIRSAYPGNMVVVVSHVTPIKVLLRDALAASDAFLHRMHLDPAGLSIVDSWPDGGVSVRTVNDTSHVPPAGRR